MKQSIITTRMFEDAREYWVTKLAGQWDELNLLADFPKTREYEEANCQITLKNDLAEKLITISKNDDLSLYVLLLTFFKILLYKLTDQNDIAVATAALSRSKQSYNKGIILRDLLRPEMGFKELLMKVKQTAADGYANQHYPIRRLNY